MAFKVVVKQTSPSTVFRTRNKLLRTGFQGSGGVTQPVFLVRVCLTPQQDPPHTHTIGLLFGTALLSTSPGLREIDGGRPGFCKIHVIVTVAWHLKRK